MISAVLTSCCNSQFAEIVSSVRNESVWCAHVIAGADVVVPDYKLIRMMTFKITSTKPSTVTLG